MKGLEGILDKDTCHESVPAPDRKYLNPAGGLSVAAQQTALLVSVRSIESSLKSIHKVLGSIAGWIAFFGLVLLISEFLGCVGVL